MKYQKLTKETFNDFVEKHVVSGWNPTFKNIEMPKNETEFKEFTKNIYGVELSVDCLAYPKGTLGDGYSCKYEIQGMEESEYCKKGLMPLWNDKYGKYDGLKVLLNSCFGKLYFGGVATHHYGQTKCDKGTWLRVKSWDDNNQGKVFKSAIEQIQSLNEILGGGF